jgi:hypothetical protein
MSQAPTAKELFGEHPWVDNPPPVATGTPTPFEYNPNYFATRATAAKVATIVDLGLQLPPGTSKVVPKNDITPFGPYQQNQPNLMIQIPDKSPDRLPTAPVDSKGNPVSFHNAGLIAYEFAQWPSIETINADLTQEFGQPFTFVLPKV